MTLVADSQALADVVDLVGASTLAVRGRRHALASAAVWRPGLAVTAAHVFRHPPAATTLVGADGKSVDASLVGSDAATDLALYRFDAAALPGAQALSIGDAAQRIRAGHLALAVGRAGDGALLASSGIVNRVGGPWQTWLGGAVDRLIRLDGGIDDGLSGAPVADAAGALLGVASAALSRRHGIVVPAATVTRVVEALLAGGHVKRPWLGIAAQPVPLAAPATGSGLLVTALAAGGPAERAGVLIGDIVVRAAGQPAVDLGALRAALAAHVGGKATLAIVRGGEPREVEVEVGEWPTARRCH